jgi:hypothetical protein
LTKQIFSSEEVEKIVGWAVSFQLMSAANSDISANGKLQLTDKSIDYGIQMLKNSEPESSHREVCAHNPPLISLEISERG